MASVIITFFFLKYMRMTKERVTGNKWQLSLACSDLTATWRWGFFKPIRYYFRPERGEFFELGIAVLNIKSVSVLETLFNV